MGGGVLALSPVVLHLLYIVWLLPRVSTAANFPVGTTLRPTGANSTPWSSDNNTFSLAFVPDSTHPSLYLATVSYAGGIPVWTPGANTSVDASGSLTLDSSGDLRILNGSGTLLWHTSTSGLGVTAAVLDETGNLRLVATNISTVWRSFDHPTDTLLATQNFTSGQKLVSGGGGGGGGVYSLTLSTTGNITLSWNSSIVYYNKGLNSSFTPNRTLPAPSMVLSTDGILSLTDPSLAGPIVVAYSSNYGESGDMMRFLRLDSDGNLRAYSSLRGSGTAIDRWAAVGDQCQVFGYCGNMGVCSYNDSSPICSCPSENFVPVDPGNSRMGCRRTNEIRNCPGNSTMLQLDHTQFLTYPPEVVTEQFFIGITACRTNCLAGGSCVASTALADGSGLCYLKVSNYVSIYQSASLPSTSFVKVCAPAIANPTPALFGNAGKRSSRLSAAVIAIVVVGTIVTLVLLEFGLWWLFCRNNPKYGSSSANYALLEYASGAPVQFSYRELHRATKGFREKLGAGGFGAVYRGVLVNRTVVAVKQLEGIEQGEKQFRMEVATISSTHHLNLVRLIGFCSEGRHRLLVYEFMKNSSLDHHLFSSESSSKFSWATRFAVAIGTARGITYLHEECRDCIVHCDIKPENILLDESCNAKVSDFGLAKLVHPKEHRTLTSVRGTRGYLAPEWLANFPITSKSDVYSYGMVLLEIVSGKRNFDVSEETGRKKFSVWAYQEFDRGNLRSIVDKRLAGQDVDMEQVERAVQVSFWCIQDQPSQRPSMGKVVQMLEGIMVIEWPPAPRAVDGSMSITSASTNFTTSAPNSSIHTSFHAKGALSSISARNVEGAT